MVDRMIIGTTLTSTWRGDPDDQGRVTRKETPVTIDGIAMQIIWQSDLGVRIFGSNGLAVTDGWTRHVSLARGRYTTIVTPYTPAEVSALAYLRTSEFFENLQRMTHP